MLLARLPMLLPCMFFMLGIAVGELTDLFSPFFPWLAAVAVMSMLSVLIFFFCRYRGLTSFRAVSVLAGLMLSALFFFLGVAVVRSHFSCVENPALSRRGVYRLVVSSPPESKPHSLAVEADVLSFSAADSLPSVPSYGRVILYLSPSSRSVSVGDTALFYGCMTKPHGGNPEAFDYARYLHFRGVTASAFADSSSFRVISEPASLPLACYPSVFRRYLVDRLRSLGLSDVSLSVVSALVLGYKAELSPEVKETFNDAGVSHVLAVSGLHVGIVMLLFSLLLRLDLNVACRRRPKVVALVLLLWLYALLTGASPSVCRAVFMTSVLLLGYVFARPSSPVNSLFLSAFVLLLVNPYNLFSVGFLLSYAAVLGILVLGKPLLSLLSHEYRKGSGVLRRLSVWAYDMVVITFVAQLFTLPIILYCFHRFTFASFLANFFAIPLAGLVIYLAVFALIVSGVGFLAPLVSAVLDYVTSLFCSLVSAVTTLSFLRSDVYVSVTQTLLLCVAVASLCVLVVLECRRRRSFSLALTSVVMFLVSLSSVLALSLVRECRCSRQGVVCVYAQSGVSRADLSVSVLSGSRSVMFTTDSSAVWRQASPFLLSRCVDSTRVVSISDLSSPLLFTVSGTRYLVPPSCPSVFDYSSASPLSVDVLVLNPRSDLSYPRLCRLFAFSSVVVPSSVPSFKTRRFASLARADGVSVYLVSESGAYLRYE